MSEAVQEFCFHSSPWVPNTQATYYGTQICDHFVPYEELERGLDHVLREMQERAERIGGNAYTSFELTTDHNAEKDGLPVVHLHGVGCAAKLVNQYP